MVGAKAVGADEVKARSQGGWRRRRGRVARPAPVGDAAVGDARVAEADSEPREGSKTTSTPAGFSKGW